MNPARWEGGFEHQFYSKGTTKYCYNVRKDKKTIVHFVAKIIPGEILCVTKFIKYKQIIHAFGCCNYNHATFP